MQYVLRRWFVKFWKRERKKLFREGEIKREWLVAVADIALPEQNVINCIFAS
jgi:hypothetical protein